MRLPANPPSNWLDLELNFTALERNLTAVAIQLTFLGGLKFHAGVGVPSFSADGGSFYFNQATPGAAGQHIYFNTANGNNWTGIA